MITELVKVDTTDQIRLDGALFLPIEQSSSVEKAEQQVAVDALICLHGAGSNFYGSSTLDEITAPLVNNGIAVLRVNTRGHDWVYPKLVRFQVTKQGSSYEKVSQCVIDIRAWVDLLIARGCRRIGLLGHSLGAIKAVYAMAHQPIAEVQRVVAISPPRLSFSYFRESPTGPQFFAEYHEAKKMIEAGAGNQLIEVKHPLPFMITAKGFVEKYGPDENYNILKMADRVPCPALYIYGARELKAGYAFVGMPEALLSLSGGDDQKTSDIQTCIIPGANHLYAGKTSELAVKVCQWLRL